MRAPPWKTQAQRTKVLKLARELARTGQHSDHRSIIAQLEPVEGFAEARVRFEESVIRLQLDRLCAIARASRTQAGRTNGS
jgi:hypothetical protein